MRLLVFVCVLSLSVACTGPHATVPTLTPGLGNTRPAPTATVAEAVTMPPPTATLDGAATRTQLPSTATPRLQAMPTPADGTMLIQVGDYFFLPAHITVTVGTKVIWHPVGELFHTVVPKDPPNAWRNGVTAGMGSRDFEWTFNRPGTIYYHCDYHPGAMDAILVVVDEV